LTPNGEAQSKWVIDAAAKYPGKPIKYLILTHHHMDHAGGMRTYAAEGATIIVPAPDKAYFEKDLKTTHTVVPDALQKAPKQVEIIEVKDQLTLKDDGGEIRLYRIDNPHVDGMLIGHAEGQCGLGDGPVFAGPRHHQKCGKFVSCSDDQKARHHRRDLRRRSRRQRHAGRSRGHHVAELRPRKSQRGYRN
jgi:hypothetical protein